MRADDPYRDAPKLPEGGPLDLRTLVGSTDPVELDVGSGRGWFMVGRLEADPRARIVGFEIKRKWATIVDRRLETRGLATRGRVFAEDVRGVLPRLVSGCLSVVYFHFPDPWWKKRHHKRLVLTKELLTHLARALAQSGELFIQTDVEIRALGYEGLVAECPLFEPFENAARVAANPYGVPSPREARAIADGLPVFRLRYRLKLGRNG